MASHVVWLAFFIGAIFGFVAQRHRFCTMGAIADIVHSQDWERFGIWLFAIAIAITGTYTLAHLHWINLSHSIYLASELPWLAHIVGGAFFGFGMVFASGCGSKTLLRIGSGSLKAVVVFVVLGLFAFMTLKGILAFPRVWLNQVASLHLPASQDLPSMIRQLPGLHDLPGLVIPVLSALAFAGFALTRRNFRSMENMMAGVLLGACIVAAWYVSGYLGYVAEDPDTLQELYVATNSGKMESLSFVAPFAYTLDLFMMWSDTSKAVSFGIAAALGVILGAWIQSLVSRSFRWEGFSGLDDTATHLVGAAMMGFGGVTALGCTVGQGMSGLSTLSLGSFLTFFAIIGGAWAALRVQMWRLDHAQ